MVQAKKLSFSSTQVGEKLDVIDNECIRTVPIHGIWSEAVVVAKDADSITVHYLCWDSKFDEKVPRSQFSRRVRQYGSRTFVEGGVIRRHNRLDVLDVHPSRNKWCTGYVVDARENQVLIHYKGYDKKFDEWIGKYSSRLAPYGRRQFQSHVDLELQQRMQESQSVHIPRWGPNAASVAQASSGVGGADKSRPESEGGPEVDEAAVSEADKQREAARQHQVYIASLFKKFSLKRKKQAPDGNCLFRSISDQVYGDPRYHAIVRGYTVDYMQIQQNSFQPFVAQSMRDFKVYLRLMRCNGTNYKAVWGGEPELQAMSELYQRHIIVFSARARTGEAYVHAEYGTGFKQSKSEPIRLNFYQYGHYDSAVPARPSDIREQTYPQPGQVELALLKLLSHAASSTLGGPSSPESQQLLAAIAESRQLWHTQSAKTMEQALKQSVAIEDQKALQMALEASSKQDGGAAESGRSRSCSSRSSDSTGSTVAQKRYKQTTESKEETVEMDLILTAVNQSLAEQQKQEEEALQKALQMSRQQQPPAAAAADDAFQATLQSSAQQHAESALLLSTMEASAQDAKVEQLMAIMPGAGTTPPEYLRTQARFCLESANWDVEVAVANLFSSF